MDRHTRSATPLAAARLSRRRVLRLAALSPLALALSGEAAAPFPDVPATARTLSPQEVTAGSWQSWLVPSALTFRPAPPPGHSSSRIRAELRELLDLQTQRGDVARAIIDFWDAQGGIPRWSGILLDKIKQNRVNPVRTARALALFHAAIADASICAWDCKFAYNRPQPSTLERRMSPAIRGVDRLPSYPSEHATVAGAATVVLGLLFPAQTAVVRGRTMTFDAMANEAAMSRLWAGANYRSDVDAGLRLGQAVGWLAVQRGMSDGASAAWDATAQPGRLTGPQYWAPTPPANVFPPLEPLAGFWDPWLLESPSQFRPSAPPALQNVFPSAQFLAEVQEVKHTVDSLSEAQHQIALYWANHPGESATPPGEWSRVAAGLVAAARWSTPRAARALALVGVGLADSAIACWDCKYAYWGLRPVTAIRTLKGQPFYDPSFVTPIPTPPFRAYTSLVRPAADASCPRADQSINHGSIEVASRVHPACSYWTT